MLQLLATIMCFCAELNELGEDKTQKDSKTAVRKSKLTKKPKPNKAHPNNEACYFLHFAGLTSRLSSKLLPAAKNTTHILLLQDRFPGSVPRPTDRISTFCFPAVFLLTLRRVIAIKSS